MREYQRKRRIRKILYSRGALAVAFILLLLIGKATWGLYIKERESRKNLDRVEAELSALTARERKLQEDIARLQTPEGLESEIREQFQVAKPGEQMVVLVGEEKAAAVESVTEPSFVSKFFDLFR